MSVSDFKGICEGCFNWDIRDLYVQGLKERSHTENQTQAMNLVFAVKQAIHDAKCRYKAPNASATYWFPHKFQGSDLSMVHKVKNFLNAALRNSNCNCIVMVGSTKESGYPPSHKRIYFVCPRFLATKVNESQTTGIRSTKTHRPTTDKRCCFRITANVELLDPDTKQSISNGRWYIRLDTGIVLEHKHHAPFVRPLRQSRRDIKPEFQRLLKVIFGHGLAPTTGHDLLEALSGDNYDKKVIANVYRDLMYKPISGRKRSAGQQLLDFLQSDPTITFVYYTATPEQGGSLLTIRKKTRGKVTNLDPKEYQTNELKALVKGMSLQDGREVLIAVAWMSDLQRRLYSIHPHYLGIDCTFSTNAEKRALFKVIGRDASNRNIPLMCAFLPSLCEWVFHWIFRDVLPTLFGTQNLQQLRLLTTDEDKFCIGAFQALQPLHYKDCQVRLCKWHKVNRNYSTKVARWCESKEDRAFVRMVTCWLYSFTRDIETEQEENDSMEALSTFVSTSTNVAQKVVLSTQDFLTKSFWKSLPQLCSRHFLDVPNGDRADNCAVESENSSLKRNRRGPKPYHPLNRSGKALVNRDTEYLGNYLHHINKGMSSAPQPRRSETVEQQVQRELEVDIVEGKAKRAVSEWVEGAFGLYQVHETGPNIQPCFQNGKPMFDMNVTPPEFQSFYVSRRDGALLPNRHAPRPKHNRTRSTENKCIFTCSCGLFQRELVLCRHARAVIFDPPVIDDQHPQCMKMFIQMGIDNDQFRDEVMQRIHMIQIFQGVPMNQYPYPFQLPSHVLENHMALAGTIQPPGPRVVTPHSKLLLGKTTYRPSSLLKNAPLDQPSSLLKNAPLVPPAAKKKTPPPKPPAPQTLLEFLGNNKNLEKKMHEWGIRMFRRATGNCINLDICIELEKKLLEAVEVTTRMASQARGSQGEGVAGFGNLDRRQFNHRYSASSPGRVGRAPTKKPVSSLNHHTAPVVIDLTIDSDPEDKKPQAKKSRKYTHQKDMEPPAKKARKITLPVLPSDSESDNENETTVKPSAKHPAKKARKISLPCAKPPATKARRILSDYLSDSGSDSELDALLSFDFRKSKNSCKLQTNKATSALSSYLSESDSDTDPPLRETEHYTMTPKPNPELRWRQFEIEQQLRDNLHKLRKDMESSPNSVSVPQVERKTKSNLDRLLFGDD